MKTKILIALSLITVFTLFSCEKVNYPKEVTTETSDSTETASNDETEYEGETENVPQYRLELNDNGSILVTDDEGIPLTYDDEVNYSNLPLRQIFFATELGGYNLQKYYENISGKEADMRDRYYGYKNTKDYIDFVNSKINLVFNLPLKTDDEELNEVFNKLYYDYIDYQFYEGDRGYGWQKFNFHKDGGNRDKYVNISRDKETGNLKAYGSW